MKIICLSNEGKNLSEKAGYPNDYVSLSMKVGAEYVVYAMGVWDDYLYYLLKPDHENPDLNIGPVWYPYEWFEISDHKVPINWFFTHEGGTNIKKLSTIWGYKEIVFDTEHERGLMERNSNDLEIFYTRKTEIDQAL